ncbi:MAG TPA: alkaline phosphatase family protein [Trebonia sp.]|nr:alkaline phosphatase family protein [Trebonia sp.]
MGTGAAIGVSAATASSAKANGLAGYTVPKTVSTTLYRPPNTTTPIKHLVVIFDENESFDHYFGTYPYAANTDGTPFVAKPGTPTVNGLYTKITKSGPTGPLLTSNPNEYNPQRLTHSQALTSDQNHSYTPEQEAEDNGKMDKFVQETESATPAGGCGAEYCPPGIVMDYYDGNTVTGLWNYAQYYSMGDNDWDPDFGPSSPGAVNVTAGDTSGAEAVSPLDSTTPGAPTTSSSVVDVSPTTHLGTLNGDIDPYYDQCSDSNHTTTGATGILTGQNIGDLLNDSHITWGWFEGGFAPTSTNSGGAVCGSEHENIGGAEVQDYVPHHDPFQYYASTANPEHLPPSSLSEIGYTDQANHQYDTSDFTDALNGTGGAQLPAVSYIKPPAYQNGHPGNSDPTDEQTFLVNTINSIQKSKYWSSTAIVITYDDSDGWYDHQAPKITNGSNDPAIDTAECTSVPVTVGTVNGRCGESQRLPFMVISPYSRQNYVSSVNTNTSSVLKFVEQNWLHSESIPGSYDATAGSIDGPGGELNFQQHPHVQPVILDPSSGAVVSGGSWYGNEGKKS